MAVLPTAKILHLIIYSLFSHILYNTGNRLIVQKSWKNEIYRYIKYKYLNLFFIYSMSNWFIWTDFTVLLHDNMKYSNTLTIFIRISNIIAPSYDFFNELQKNQIIFDIAHYAIVDAFHKRVINQKILRE